MRKESEWKEKGERKRGKSKDERRETTRASEEANAFWTTCNKNKGLKKGERRREGPERGDGGR